MKKGDRIRTPRFCTVEIKKVFRSYDTARKQGFIESTYYDDWEYDIRGKHTGTNTMIFAAIKR